MEDLMTEEERLLAIIARNKVTFDRIQEAAQAWRREALQLRIICLQQKAKLQSQARVQSPPGDVAAELEN